MTAKEIQKIAGRYFMQKQHLFCVENLSSHSLTHWEIDLASFTKAAFLYENEIKTSRPDFLNDQKKYFFQQKGISKFEAYDNAEEQWHSIPNYFSYWCVEGLIRLEEIPPFAGLYYVGGSSLYQTEEIRRPKRLHSNKIDLDKAKETFLRIYSERHFFDGKCKMTWHNQKVKERNKKRLASH